MNGGLVRTKMAQSFVDCCSPDNLRGKRLNRTSRKVVHRVLTNVAANVGVKYDPNRKPKKLKKQAAETAVMKEAA